MRRLWLVACSLAACDFTRSGRDNIPPDTRDIDASVAMEDAPTDAPGSTCRQKWASGSVQLGPPTKLAISSGSTDRDPYVAPDGLTLYFQSDRSGSQGTDLYAAKRPTTADAFAAPQRVDELSTGEDESRFTMSGDGLIGVVASNRTGSAGGSSDLWIGTRATTSDAFGTFTQFGAVATLNDGNAQLDPELSADGLRLYYAIGGPQRIVMASRATTAAAFINPTNVISGSSGNADPTLSPDELVIVFAATRAATKSGANIWYATRSDTGVAFGNPVELTELSSDSNDGDPTLSQDGCQLFFASDRDGDYDLWVASVL